MSTDTTESFEDVVKERDKLREVLNDIAIHGLRCDMNPTIAHGNLFDDGTEMYMFLINYFSRSEKYLMERAGIAVGRNPLPASNPVYSV